MGSERDRGWAEKGERVAERGMGGVRCERGRMGDEYERGRV